MLLTITTTHKPATDLGYLLHKHPENPQTIELPFGKAHIFYPERSSEKTTAALMLDINPIELAKKYKGKYRQKIDANHYVNPMPYTASSFLSVAISKAFSSAMNGRSKERPELVDQPIAIKGTIASLPGRNGGEKLIQSLFEPMGYNVEVETFPMNVNFPEWGNSPYYNVSLEHQIPLRYFLSHLYILIPVLDFNKHYFVGQDEVDKLKAKAGEWLHDHPLKDLIIKRYLLNIGTLSKAASAEFTSEENAEEPQESQLEQSIEKFNLHQFRLQTVLETLKACNAKKVLDLGCGEGKLLKLLQKEDCFTEILGTDVSLSALQKAKTRLRLDRKHAAANPKINLLQSALTYRDDRLQGYDAAALVEVIEHLDEPRLNAFEEVVFKYAQPKVVIITTPNQEYNVLFEGMQPGQMRHKDHRFEWTRNEFETWAQKVADRFGYQVNFSPLGPENPKFGAPSQMAVFRYGN